MNFEAQEYLNKILTKNPSELTEDEKGFLKARSSYLKDSQLKEYESVLNPENQTSVETEPVKSHGKARKTN
ncbi:MAG: hypothetical protein AAB706_02530 [Patescibacteria group bacterium]